MIPKKATRHFYSMGDTPTSTIVHLDVDAFYVACERELRPDLRKRPLAVSQYNPYGNLCTREIEDPARILYDGNRAQAKKNRDVNGSLIAVSYEARARHVKRNDRGLEAVRKCPEMVIIQVPVDNGKANLSIYRDASERLMVALADFMKASAMDVAHELSSAATSTGDGCDASNSSHDNVKIKAMSTIKVEKASVDEIYIDLSLPVQSILQFCKTTDAWDALRVALLREGSASTHTTVGGLETSEAAVATNSLSKDEIRRGSSLQVEDSEDAATAEDKAGAAWWGRAFPQAWSDDEISLAIGALVTLKARQSIVTKFDGIFTLSAGVSTNKAMAKLASGLRKPNRQTLININDETTLQKLFHPLPLSRIRGLGGKFGEKVAETLQVKTVGELAKIPLTTLQQAFGEKQARFLFRTAQGICDEAVAERTKTNCIGAGKTFQGALSIRSSDHETLKKWLCNLVADVMERMHSDKARYAKTLVCWLNMTPREGKRKQVSMSAPLPRNATAEKFVAVAFQLVKDIIKGAGNGGDPNNDSSLMIVGMAVTATNFVSIAQGPSSIQDAFKRTAELSQPSRVVSAGKSPTSHRAPGQKERELPLQLQTVQSIGNSLQPIQTNGDTTSTSGVTLLTSGRATPSISDVAGATVAYTKHEQQEGAVPTLAAEQGMDTITITQAEELPDIQHAIFLHGESYQEAGGDQDLALDSTARFQTPQLSASVHEVDPDLEYAKQLQASFDRENEVISGMEERRSMSIPKRQPGEGRPGRNSKRRRSSNLAAVARPISNFFPKLS
jgi:nucleotidyltransferase/DNA polymerase involved in DNA repair